MTTYAIETHELTRTFHRQVAVNGLNLSVKSAEVYCFLGPNGAGKTTTIRMLLGLIKPDSGSIRLFGKTADTKNVDGKKIIGSLVGDLSFYPHLSGRENMEILCRMRQLPMSEIERTLHIVNLKTQAKKSVKHYSHGMQQRLCIAFALLGNPKLLILDEPTNGLDPEGILEIRSLMRNLTHQEGLTVFVSSHLLSEVEQIADTIGIIQNGRLLFQGPKQSLQAEYPAEVLLKTGHPEHALQTLASGGWKAIMEDGMLRIDSQRKDDVPKIIQLLSEQHIDIFEARPSIPTLEDLFMRKTAVRDEREG